MSQTAEKTQYKGPLGLVRSEVFGDCGVCCACMITGKTRSAILDSATLSNFQGIEYLSVPEMFSVLLRNDVVPYLTFRPKFQPLDPSQIDGFLVEVDLSNHALLTVPSPISSEFMHYTVWDGSRKKVLDPSLQEPRSITEYKIIEWHPMTVWR